MSDFFTSKQEGLMLQLRVIKQCVEEQQLRAAPCQLLVSQLEELRVFTNKLSDLTNKMLADLKDQTP